MPKHDHPPAFQFYVDDFLTDSAVDAMTNEELGIYIRLLCKAWKEEPVGTLPNDDRILANWGKTTPATWKRCRAGILRAFTVEADRLVQKRMKTEWQKLLDFREERSRSGKRGNQKRWHGDSSATHQGEQSYRSDIAQPSHSDAKTVATDRFSSSSSFSSSNKDVDVCKNILSGEEGERLLERARRIQKQTKIDCRNPDDRSLIAKIAVLWDSGEFSDEDVEHVLQSFDGSAIKKRGGYLHKCMANRCEMQRKDFNGLLARTVVPAVLLVPATAGANA